jgi:hypothetical protein
MRIAEMSNKIARFVSLASLLWVHLNSLRYSKEIRDLDYVRHHTTAACVVDK